MKEDDLWGNSPLLLINNAGNNDFINKIFYYLLFI